MREFSAAMFMLLAILLLVPFAWAILAGIGALMGIVINWAFGYAFPLKAYAAAGLFIATLSGGAAKAAPK